MNSQFVIMNIIYMLMSSICLNLFCSGHFIPKGWCVFTYFRSIHLDKDFYESPYKFNPWRWQVSAIMSLDSSLIFLDFNSEVWTFSFQIYRKFQWFYGGWADNDGRHELMHLICSSFMMRKRIWVAVVLFHLEEARDFTRALTWKD